MAEKLAGSYRYVKKDGDSVSRVILSAGDDVPKDLDKKQRENLKKAGLIVDERRLSADNLRLPYGHPDSGEETRAAASDEDSDDENKGEEKKGTAKKQTGSGNSGS